MRKIFSFESVGMSFFKFLERLFFKALNKPSLWKGRLLPSGWHCLLAIRGNVLVLSEEEASRFIPPNNAVLLRICDPGRELKLPQPKDGWLDVKTISFIDVVSKMDLDVVEKSEAYKTMSSSVPAIQQFVAEHSSKFIAIHCQAGVSRSAAVGAYICHVRKKRDLVRMMQESGGQWIPNYWLLSLLKKR